VIMRRLAALLLLPAVLAAQTPNNSKLAERLKQHKIARFFQRLQTDRKLDEGTRAQLMELRPGATLGGEYGCIHQALLLRYPEYKRADALLLDERYAAAAAAFARLKQSGDEYLRAYADFRYGLAQMNRDRFEEAATVFTETLNEWGKIAGCDIEAAFYRVICLGQAREKEQAITAASNFLRDYPEAPARFREAMEQIRNELTQEWQSPLYDLAGRMNHAARRIESGSTGKDTHKEQAEIVDILDELIRRAKQGEGQGQGNGGGGGPPRGNDPSSSPANRSSAPPGASRIGDLRPKPKRRPGREWGAMRAKEREEVLQALKEKFPDRYRALLEQYSKALAEGKRVTETAEDR